MISLEPLTMDLARKVLGHLALDVAHAHDWPHEDSYDAMRMFAGDPGTFLVLEDGVVVGDCGWFGPPDEAGEVEIGYGLAPSVRGRGLGSEAVALLVAWVAEKGATSVRAEVLPGNEASLRLLARQGFSDTGMRAEHRVLVRALSPTAAAGPPA